jgi:hypothetical protein
MTDDSFKKKGWKQDPGTEWIVKKETVTSDTPTDEPKKDWGKIAKRIQRMQASFDGHSPDVTRAELVLYDDAGKPLRIVELTAPPALSFETESRELQGKFKPNKRKEKLGKMQFKNNMALTMNCYYDKPLNEIPRLQKNSTGGSLVITGGAHVIALGLNVPKAKELRRMLDKLIWRLRKAPFQRKFSIIIDSKHSGEKPSEADLEEMHLENNAKRDKFHFSESGRDAEKA